MYVSFPYPGIKSKADVHEKKPNDTTNDAPDLSMLQMITVQYVLK